jgi:hypothetical protein
MPTFVRRADRSEVTAPPESIARSVAVLEVAGFTVLELLRPVHETWPLVALTGSHPGVLLVGVFATLPDPLDPRLALPGGFPPHTRRLLHAWPTEGALPAALLL